MEMMSRFDYSEDAFYGGIQLLRRNQQEIKDESILKELELFEL